MLIHADRHEGREIWFARSVLTADIAHGASPEEALDLLNQAIVAAVASARSRGLSARAWHEAQPADEPVWVAEWCRLRLQEDECMSAVEDEGLRIEAQVVRRRAA